MRYYLWHVSKFFLAIAVLLFGISFIAAWSNGTGMALSFVGLPLVAIIAFVGACVWSFRGIKLAPSLTTFRERVTVCTASPVLFLCTLLSAWPVLGAGSFVGSLSRLAVNHAHYERIISKVKIGRRPSWYANDDGVTYSVDLGPPIRIAFNPEGILDNWTAIVYDPTGVVMLADGFDPKTGKFVAPDRVTKLFDGNLVDCRHLWGAYYDCSFT